jgi:hypothetical protein
LNTIFLASTKWHLPTSLGRIPKPWEVKTIADICQSVSYGVTLPGAE